ncbi:nicotinate-nucleotide adenylyltransferase [Spirochaeta africana]|uniref:Probable nicotinate-nucleotide adenylyltransferase n=1 Tax=Spirochaeta africana (strain ATCC 700263 / DSM 8902 / Z-7692) TaxID=889378 RepID=H9UK92_SPIAZ|nr:nicotinate-nucleotide adenylyltransferase [Spirochaeta africana]AFG37935.1 nicotinate/nicotinamide nucleotide adenylyltransferase [Spirochaeta africana DSM 8902]
MRESTAVFGGSFDPLHNGHLAIAREAVSRGYCRRVIWIPAARNPHKHSGPQAADELRLQMLRRAVEDLPWSSVSDIEIRRGGRSYTLETIKQLVSEHDLAEPWFLLGEDAMAGLPDWHGYSELVKRCSFLVCTRSGDSDAESERLLLEQRLQADGVRLRRIEIDPIDVSSTEIRMRARRGQDIYQLVPAVVADCIVHEALYTGIPEVYPDICARAEQEMSQQRFAHSLRVETTAMHLAERHRVPIWPVRLAAIAHDLVREWSPQRLLSYARQFGLAVSDQQLATPVLLHGLCAADLLHREYGILHESVLRAVAHHTLGQRGMDDIGKVLFVADYAEPGRRLPDPRLRQALQNADLSESCAMVLEDQRSRFGELSPDTRLFYEWLKGR